MSNKEVVIGTTKFIIPQWTLRQKLENKALFMPLATAPIVNGIMASERDESELIGFIVSGMLDAFCQSDSIPIVEKAFQGVGIQLEGKGVVQARTIDELDNLGIDLGDVYVVIAHIVQDNYGTSLKKAIEDSLKSMTNL